MRGVFTIARAHGVLKSADAALRFVMLTGVTRFSKVSIFSDLNQLKEIGLNKDYAAVCGITEGELLENFKSELEALAQENQESFEQTLEAVRRNFNGYRFAKDSESVYNPFSVLNTFANRDIQYYWFATGTPTFLFRELERTKFDITLFKNNIEVPEPAINDYQSGDATPIPLLYQSGYVTITGYDKEIRAYKLGFPNEEVQYGFLNNLYKYLFPVQSGSAEDALKQIDGKGYLLPYSAGGQRLVKAGGVFDTERRTLGEWRIQGP
jgi:hypothetical protein